MVKLYKFFLKEPNNVTLTEIEDFEMEAALSIVPGRRIKRPGKEAMEHLPLQGPRPPLVTSVNIVVKILDPVNFPTLSNYARQMIQGLQRNNILNEVIGRNIKGEVREYKFDKASNRMKIIGSKINSYNIVPKESYIYAMTLPNNHYVMLRHLRGRWFRCLAYFSDHDSYSNFLNVFFTNKTIIFFYHAEEINCNM